MTNQWTTQAHKTNETALALALTYRHYMDKPLTNEYEQGVAAGLKAAYQIAEGPHRPSLVLELHPSHWTYCLYCQQKWPCPAAPEEICRHTSESSPPQPSTSKTSNPTH